MKKLLDYLQVIQEDKSNKNVYYHCSINKTLKPGDKIQPYFKAKEYIERIRKQAYDRGIHDIYSAYYLFTEKLLEKYRPKNKPKRNKTVFVFKTLKNAKEYIGKNKLYSIYEVSSKKPIEFFDMNARDHIESSVFTLDKDLKEQQEYDRDSWIEENPDRPEEENPYGYTDENEELLNKEWEKISFKQQKERCKKYWNNEADLSWNSKPLWEGFTNEFVTVIKKIK